MSSQVENSFGLDGNLNHRGGIQPQNWQSHSGGRNAGRGRKHAKSSSGEKVPRFEELRPRVSVLVRVERPREAIHVERYFGGQIGRKSGIQQAEQPSTTRYWGKKLPGDNQGPGTGLPSYPGTAPGTRSDRAQDVVSEGNPGPGPDCPKRGPGKSSKRGPGKHRRAGKSAENLTPWVRAPPVAVPPPPSSGLCFGPAECGGVVLASLSGQLASAIHGLRSPGILARGRASCPGPGVASMLPRASAAGRPCPVPRPHGRGLSVAKATSGARWQKPGPLRSQRTHSGAFCLASPGAFGAHEGPCVGRRGRRRGGAGPVSPGQARQRPAARLAGRPGTLIAAPWTLG